jgi:hypothetical protein
MEEFEMMKTVELICHFLRVLALQLLLRQQEEAGSSGGFKLTSKNLSMNNLVLSQQ